MERSVIAVPDLELRVFDFWPEHWILLTAGDFASRNFNTMAVGWGGLGNMWNKSFAHVVVRPGRYTHRLMEEFESFTLCAFPEKFEKAVQLLGRKSGRDGDKIAEAGLTPVASTRIAAPGFAEAELILECRKIYRAEIDPRGFLDEKIAAQYPLKDYHTIYYGEVLAVSGVDSFRRE